MATATTTQKTNQKTTTASDMTSNTQQAQQAQQAQQVQLPDWLQSLIQSGVGTAGQGLDAFASGVNNYQLPPDAMQALHDTAAGNYLYGGPAMDAFTQAAQRAALPGIISTFGGAGRGTGGLAQTALGTAGIDAYAGLYNQERDRQMSAANAIPGFSLLPLQLQQQLTQLGSSIPGAFSSLFGQSGTSSGSGTSATQGTENSISKTKGTTTTTQPLYQSPWWQTPLALGATAIGGLGSLFPPSAAAQAAGGFAGGPLGGLLGTIR